MRVQELSKIYNLSESFFEIITDEDRTNLVIKDIKSDIGNVHIEVLQFIRNTEHFPKLENQLQFKREVLASINDLKKRTSLNNEIQKIEKEIKRYKIDILITSSSLVAIEETSRIKKVKDFFFQGQISKAANIINECKLEESKIKLTSLLETKEKLKQVYQKLVDNAFEFIVKAQLTTLNFDIKCSEDRYQKSKEFYMKGIISIERSKIIHKEAEYKLKYSNFLRNHNDIEDVESLIKQGLKINRSLALRNSTTFLPNVALILQSLANYQSDQNEIEEAEKSFIEALRVRRKLLKERPNEYLPQMGSVLEDFGTFIMKKNNFIKAKKLYSEALKIRRKLVTYDSKLYTPVLSSNLNSLGILYRYLDEFEKAEAHYLESLNIRYYLSEDKPNTYLPTVVEVQNNLGILYCDKNNFNKAVDIYNDALNILDKLSKENPKVYLPKLGQLLNNLGIIYRNINNLSKAEKSFNKALKIFRELSKKNPKKFIPYLAGTLLNLSRFYQKQIENKELSLKLIDEILTLLFPFLHIPYIQDYINEACKTLNKWGIDYKVYLSEKNFS